MTLRTALATVACLISLSGHAMADSSGSAATVTDNGREKLAEIIVTAQRRAESLEDVPLSIAAYGQADITRLAISGIDDLQRLTPDIAFQYNLAYSPQISIRGISDDLGAATTGLYIDDTPRQARGIRLLDKLAATAGLRYSKMDFRHSNAQDGFFNGGPSALSGSALLGGANRFRATDDSSSAADASGWQPSSRMAPPYASFSSLDT